MRGGKWENQDRLNTDSHNLPYNNSIKTRIMHHHYYLSIIRLPVLIVFGLSLLLSACGGGNSGGNEPNTKPAPRLEADASKSTVTVSPAGAVNAGTAIIITVYAKDKNGNSLTRGGDDVQGSITGANAQALVFKDNQNGIYDASYTPLETGVDLYNISINNEPIGSTSYSVPIIRQAVVENVEVVYFKETLYSNILKTKQCDQCHIVGGAAPAIADYNVTTAFSASTVLFDPANIPFDANNPVSQTNPVIDPSIPFVSKMASGHFCWSANCDSDAQELANQLRNWVAALNRNGTVANNTPPSPSIQDILTDPPQADPSASLDFNPAVDMANGFDELYNLVTASAAGCSRCHSSGTTSNTPQRPFFAETGSAGAKQLAYDAAVSAALINLNEPAKSRLVVRPWPQQHHCGSDCQTLSFNILVVINKWAAATKAANPVFNLDQSLLPSKALFLADGQVSNGDTRYEDYVIAKYQFTEGSDEDTSNDTIAHDTSGVSPAMDLRLYGNLKWVSGFGLQFGPGGHAQSVSTSQAQKLHDLIVARGEYSIETWIIPANNYQRGNDTIQSAVMVGYSKDTANRNFTLGQDAQQYKFRNRVTTANGSVLDTPVNYDLAQPRLQHVVVTYSAIEGRRIYVNGTPIVCETDVAVSGEFPTPCQSLDSGEKDNGPITSWNPGYSLIVGSDINGANQWLGTMKFLAIHSNALTEHEIRLNYNAGVGQRFQLLFNISDFATLPQWNPAMSLGARSYIWFEVSVYDDHSYLFSNPKFIDLDYYQATPPTVNFTLKGMRIGINGKEAALGQAYARLGKSGDPYSTQELHVNIPGPVSLTRLQGEQFGITPTSGTLIPIDVDVKVDQFFLTFEAIGGLLETKIRSATPMALTPNYKGNGQAFVVGVRTFDELNATMAALTGVNQASVAFDDPNNPALKGFDNLKKQLPAKKSIEAFSAPQQMAIVALAGRYCHKRVEDQDIVSGGQTHAQYFNVPESFFSSDVATAFPSGSNSALVSTIADAILGHLVRNVNTLGNGDPDAINNVIKPQLVSLVAYLLGENDPNSNLPQPHVCDTNVQDCTGASRTKSIVKAMCTAVLASAVVTHQ